jgi:hypothetical protein
MNTLKLVGGALVLATILVSVSAALAAAPFDGSTAMQCAIKTVMSCNDPSMCVRGTAATVNMPPVVTVDVVNRLISGAATGRTVRITSVDRGAGRMMLRGQESEALGVVWDVVVAEASGDMVGAVLSHGGFLIFGTCSAP